MVLRDYRLLNDDRSYSLYSYEYSISLSKYFKGLNLMARNWIGRWDDFT
jgi:hypothetical protein